MLIDWFTVTAQIINFLILVWLLRRFLYRPIVGVMRAREVRLAAQAAEAEQALREAQQAAARYERLRGELEAAREAALHEARQAADAQRREWLHEARAEFQSAQARWRQRLDQEQTAVRRTLRERASTQTLAVARQALTDLANADLERQIAAVLIERLAGLEAPAREVLVAACRAGQPGLRVISAFELPEDVRSQLRQALRAQLGLDCQARFITDPAVVCGVEVRSDGHKVAWSLDHYLDRLETQVAEGLSEPAAA
jgi:F-type H+-transporting ATPase subunit b